MLFNLVGLSALCVLITPTLAVPTIRMAPSLTTRWQPEPNLVHWPHDVHTRKSKLRRGGGYVSAAKPRGLTNGERIRRGLPLNKPGRLHDSKRVALVPRWSGAPEADVAGLYSLEGCFTEPFTCDGLECSTIVLGDYGTAETQSAAEKDAALTECANTCFLGPGDETAGPFEVFQVHWADAGTVLFCACGFEADPENVAECTDEDFNSAQYRINSDEGPILT